MKLAPWIVATGVFAGLLSASAASSPRQAGPGRGVVTVAPLEGDVAVEEQAVTTRTELPEQAEVRTGASGRAELSGSSTWSATLGPRSEASVGLLFESENGRAVYRRVLEARDGKVLWKTIGSSVMLLPSFGRLDGASATVQVWYRDGQINIDAQEGEVKVEGKGLGVIATLSAGHKMNAKYDESTRTFRIEIIEDKGKAIDVTLGKARIRATKGDVFEVRLDGENADLLVQRGLVEVYKPDGTTEEVGQGVIVPMPGAAVGAAEGIGLRNDKAPFLVPREPVIEVLRDRTDVSPSGFR